MLALEELDEDLSEYESELLDIFNSENADDYSVHPNLKFITTEFEHIDDFITIEFKFIGELTLKELETIHEDTVYIDDFNEAAGMITMQYGALPAYAGVGTHNEPYKNWKNHVKNVDQSHSFYISVYEPELNDAFINYKANMEKIKEILT